MFNFSLENSYCSLPQLERPAGIGILTVLTVLTVTQSFMLLSNNH